MGIINISSLIGKEVRVDLIGTDNKKFHGTLVSYYSGGLPCIVLNVKFGSEYFKKIIPWSSVESITIKEE